MVDKQLLQGQCFDEATSGKTEQGELVNLEIVKYQSAEKKRESMMPEVG